MTGLDHFSSLTIGLSTLQYLVKEYFSSSVQLLAAVCDL